ncbi:sulfotransferase [Mesorhizobium sp. M4A.F.Ca.ET.020.02.1.1]|uniref:sulfotransferase n=2 Tax=Mesorhizobium TaxID=68287 RepID=UPI000FD50ED5|nr:MULTISPECIES: sulfotransferase [unclassified Mesorhizobium]RVD73640.1 sulfotransferase [Mesorhizobium sp. M4A.F.Ca.ET.029.04.2.1]RVD36789.1 sulfotransferase [Mesorhizobium sp. M4A.F.Ca.ET.020.02.1.1]RWC20870.1 MAG: sulfotransferase [Mesorhizobium sp.]RWD33469.1 MAG: sulfotransferase [Mesorhizobium sp.]RWD37507.1 MAG: sulfotransferase [Mesorhizobium sp.]
MTDGFRLLMLGAMYENGGNTTHRFLDGHPEMFVYPFESQIGTRLVNDAMTSLFPVKYRWPAFPLDAAPVDDYKLIIDEECKVRARTPYVSKFRDTAFDFNDDERCAQYIKHVEAVGRGTANNVAAFFRSTFDAWKDYNRSGREKVYVGYSPIITVDSEAILAAMPGAHMLHVVRNPFSAYADTKKRPVPMRLSDYLRAWCLNQYHALLARNRHPDRVHIVRLEDVVSDARKALAPVLSALGIDDHAALSAPTWNGLALREVYPWGTIRRATPQANRATAAELSVEEHAKVAEAAWQYLDVFDYGEFARMRPG